jgi:hypothetical protein
MIGGQRHCGVRQTSQQSTPGWSERLEASYIRALVKPQMHIECITALSQRLRLSEGQVSDR